MNNLKHRIVIFCIGAGLVLVFIGLSGYITPDAPVNAQVPEPEPHAAIVQDGITVTGDNSYCVVCHSAENRTTTLASGDVMSLHVTSDMIAGSVHGTDNPEGAFGCLDCHADASFPHDNVRPASARAYTIQANERCTQCHVEQSTALVDGVHAVGLERGNLRSATCVDCHGSHNVQPIHDDHELTVEVCGTCHVSIIAEYQESVHGRDLIDNGDANVPTCITCHGVHGGINDPTTAQARNRSPELCADCHADEDLMEQYGISTDVFDSYLSDFHGTTVALFDQQDPDVASNKAVCYDCHGVHNITPADESKSQVAKENLLATCQQCHPNATSDFPDSWVGHFAPSTDDHTMVFAVDWFYKLLIPTVLGGFAFLVMTDLFGRARRLVGGGSSHGHIDHQSENGEDNGD